MASRGEGKDRAAAGLPAPRPPDALREASALFALGRENLNLIERVWKFVKKEALRSTYHADYDSFVTTIDQWLSDLPGKHKADMDTLLAHNFQMLDVMPLLPA